jgi:hypothetical protein
MKFKLIINIYKILFKRKFLYKREFLFSKRLDSKPALGNRDRRIRQGAYTGLALLWRGIRISRPPSLALSLLLPFLTT